MIRLVTGAAVLSMGMFAVETPGLEADMTRYVVTQGGLLIVVLVLLYWQRLDQKAKNKENLEKISVLTAIAERSAVAAESSAKASEANATAIHRLSASVDGFREYITRREH